MVDSSDFSKLKSDKDDYSKCNARKHKLSYVMTLSISTGTNKIGISIAKIFKNQSDKDENNR